jgi:hypothetical protein
MDTNRLILGTLVHPGHPVLGMEILVQEEGGALVQGNRVQEVETVLETEVDLVLVLVVVLEPVLEVVLVVVLEPVREEALE